MHSACGGLDVRGLSWNDVYQPAIAIQVATYGCRFAARHPNRPPLSSPLLQMLAPLLQGGCSLVPAVLRVSAYVNRLRLLAAVVFSRPLPRRPCWPRRLCAPTSVECARTSVMLNSAFGSQCRHHNHMHSCKH